MILLITSVLITGLLPWLLPDIKIFIKYLYRMFNLTLAGTKNPTIFNNSYIEIKSFYVREFKKIPCINFIDNLDEEKVCEYITKGYAGNVLAVYEFSYYDSLNERQKSSTTVFKLGNKVMIEVGDEYASILFDSDNNTYAGNLVQTFAGYKAPRKEDDFEINIITQNNNGLDLKQLKIKPTALDIDLYYNDDFKQVDDIIKRRLSKDNDKGIILLHGLPGTGKTTYLRHLIGNLKKKVLFVSPGVAGSLMNPEFIDLLIDNPNAVLVIEDAENIIMDRKLSNNNSVSNLLNMSDGLLSDCLNVQIICTFNSHLSTIDSALLRKGRLIAKYEFNKLVKAKAQRLSDHLGFTNTIEHPMTLAEITNPDEAAAVMPSVQVLGFRREALMN